MNNPQFEIIKTLELSVIHSLSRINNLERNNLYRDSSSVYQEFKEWIHGITKEEEIWVVDNPIN